MADLTTQDPLMTVRGVRFTFPGVEQPTIDDLDFELRRGEFVAMVGPSGSGKTTMLRIAHGLLKAEAGEIVFDGRVVTGPDRSRGFVFQSDSLLPWRRVVDNVGYPLELGGTGRLEARRAAQEMLELTGLGDVGMRFPSQLSGGMRQRVNLARALVTDPGMLFMDEPFAALDAQTREVMQAELLNIWVKRKKTVLFVTHQLDEAVFLADRVIVLEGNPGQVRQVVPIDLPRPRSLDMKRTAEFAGLVDRLWSLIKDEVLLAQRVGTADH